MNSGYAGTGGRERESEATSRGNMVGDLMWP